MSREAMKQALEALESDPVSHAGLVNRKQAITALRQALETEKQEPVAWRSTSPDGKLSNKFACKPTEGNWVTPLYTAPQKQWVGLTDEEAKKTFEEHNCVISADLAGILARAIEAKLKEKNG